MIFVEPRKPHIVVVTIVGAATGANQNTQQGKLQVRPMAQKKELLDVQQEKEVFLEVQPKFVDANQSLTSGQVKTMPKWFEQLIKKPPMKNVTKIKEFFKSFLALINDKDVIPELTTLIE